MASSIPVVVPALITLLRNSADLIAISQRPDGKAQVYSASGVPKDLPPPYTVLRSVQASQQMQESSFTSRALQLLITLDTWSSYGGDEEINAMHAAIFATLNEQEAAIQALTTGYACTYCLFDTNDQLEDTSTTIKLYHGVERYRLRMEAP